LFIFSIKHSKPGDCSTNNPALGIGADVQDIVFNYTYSVSWEVTLLFNTFLLFPCATISIFLDR